MAHDRKTGWKWFAAWSVAGSLPFAVLDLLGIGLFILPLAIVVLWLVISRARRWPESLGMFLGWGVISLVLAWANRDYVMPCSPGLVLSSGGSCGGFPPFPPLIIGLVLAVGAVITYAALNRRSRIGAPLG